MSASQVCCLRSPLYNVRRYDPVGRTLWVRDYFAGYTGQLVQELSTQTCRVAILGERVYVSGPLVWVDEDRQSTYWNMVCYSMAGNFIWKAMIGDEPSHVLDVATVNGSLYALLQHPDYENTTLIEFDQEGRTVNAQAMGARIGTRLKVGNPETEYGGLPAGLTLYGDFPDAAICVAYDPIGDDFIAGFQSIPNPAQPGGFLTNAIIIRSPATTARIDYGTFLGHEEWSIFNGDNYFGSPDRLFIPPLDLSTAPDGGAFIASPYAAYRKLIGTQEDGFYQTLGVGSIVRLDANGDPTWFRGASVATCIASDSERLFVGSQATTPSIMRWTLDGEYVWGHWHNHALQIAIVDDRGIITISNRVEYGKNEVNWVGEPLP